MQKIVPCLWFDKEAEEAIKLYISIFNSAPHSAKNSKIVSIERYPYKPLDIPVKGMEGKILTAIFELSGQRFMALDGGPLFKFTEATSFDVECEDQEEVDYFWEKLSAVPDAERCGWLKDRYGLSWQIIPKRMGELLSDKDKVKARRVMDAMLKMKKIVIKDLEKAYEG
ncbi:MAG TPA: VOC family protein [Candidatus Sulfotelmatobacter sp.]|nr:VOC family protein [Candidatus Sulfotelmatobacter sp.]